MPADVSRSSTGAVIAWDFTGTHGWLRVDIPALEVETNADAIRRGHCLRPDGGAAQSDGDAVVLPHKRRRGAVGARDGAAGRRCGRAAWPCGAAAGPSST